jgi:hypothetical protein
MENRRMSPSPRRGLPAWAWIVAAPVALAAILLVVLNVAFPPAKRRALVEQQLHGALARDARFTDVTLSLWPPVRLSVKKPELAEPGGFARGAAFSADAVDLDVDLFALLGHTVRVRRLAIERPALHLVLRADGTTNLDGVAKPAPAGGGAPAAAMDLDVRAFSIHEGRVLVDDVRAGRRVAFGVGTTTSLQAASSGRVSTEGHTEISRISFGPVTATSMSEMHRGLERLTLALDHRGVFDAPTQRLALERLDLELGKARLGFSGVVDSVGPRPRYRLRARGDGVEFGQVLDWVSAVDAPAVKDLTGSGRMAFDLTVTGGAPGAMPAAEGWLTVRDADFRYAGAPADVKALALQARFAPDSVTLDPVSAQVAGQPVRARFFARRFADPLVDFSVRGKLDLAAVAPMLSQPGLALGGAADVDVRGSGRAKDPGTMALAGSAVLHDVSVAKPDLPSKVTGVNGALAFTGTSATAKGLTAHAGQSSFALDATITRPLALMAKPASVPPAGVTFDFRSPYLDLAELLPTTPGEPFLPNASGGGTVAIGRLKQGKLDVTDVAATVALAPAALSSPAFSLKGYGGTVQGSATFDLKDTRRPVYAIKAAVANAQADDLLSAWTPAKGLLRGALGTTIDFSGAGSTPADVKKTLTLVGLAALTQGQLGPGPSLQAIADYVKIPQLHEVKFQDLRLPVRVEQGRLFTDAVKLSGPSGEWTLAGAVGFDGSLDYAVSITLPKEVAAAIDQRAALAAGALADDQGRMLLDLHVGGTAASPRIAWDTQAMRARLAGRASQALAEQRAKLEAEAKTAAQQALTQRLGLAGGDSTASVPAIPGAQATKDSLKKAAGDLLKGFFGGAKKNAAPDTSAH